MNYVYINMKAYRKKEFISASQERHFSYLINKQLAVPL